MKFATPHQDRFEKNTRPEAALLRKKIMIRCDKLLYVRSKASESQLNVPYETKGKKNNYNKKLETKPICF